MMLKKVSGLQPPGYPDYIRTRYPDYSPEQLPPDNCHPVKCHLQ